MGDPKTDSGPGASRPPMSPTQARQRMDDLRTEAGRLRDGGRERDVVWQRDYEVNKELHSQREAELAEAKAEVELMTTRAKQQAEIVSRADEDIRLQTERVAELEQRVQQQGGTADPVLEVELQEAKDRLENTRSVQETDRFELQQTEARLTEANQAVESRQFQVDELLEEILLFENSSGTWAIEKARKLEAEAKTLEDGMPQLEQDWEAWEAAQPAPGDGTDLGTITVTASVADAQTEGRRERAAALEEAAAQAEGTSYADRNSASDRRELSARHTARAQEIESQITAAEARDATYAARAAESTARAEQLGTEVARQEETLKRLEDAGNTDGAEQMRARLAKSREAMESEQSRARQNELDREGIRRDVEGLRTEQARITSEAEKLEQEATILEARAEGSLETATTAREAAAAQDRIADQIEQAKATGEHVRVKYVDPEDGREVVFEIPGAVTRPDGQPRQVDIDAGAPAPATPPAAPDPAAATTPADDGGEVTITDGTEQWAAPADPAAETDPNRTTPPTSAPATVTPAPAAAAAASTATAAAADLTLTMPPAAATGTPVADWSFDEPVAPAAGDPVGAMAGSGAVDPAALDPTQLTTSDLAAEGDTGLGMDDPTLTTGGTTADGMPVLDDVGVDVGMDVDADIGAGEPGAELDTGTAADTFDDTSYDPAAGLSFEDPTAPVQDGVTEYATEYTYEDASAGVTDDAGYADDTSSDAFSE